MSSIGAIVLAIALLPFFYNVWITWRRAPKVTVNEPVGYGRSLEWATSCPPPRHNFHVDPAHPLGVAGIRPRASEAGPQIGFGPGKDAPERPVLDLAVGEVK